MPNKTNLTRRSMLGLLAGSAVVVGAPALARAKPKVVVIGGGAAGATAAKYIARDAQGAIDVTLVEPVRQYQSCFFSNLYLGGFQTYEKLLHTHDKLAGYGITLARDSASAISRDRREVRLAGGAMLSYDRLVVCPGIDLKFDSVPGYSEAAAETMPHAWQSGPQTQLLKARIDAVPDGGVVVMIAPPNPYRCPPGPYERVSMMAHTFKATGRSKCKIIILDAKDKYSKQGVFQQGWEKHYPGMVEWLPPAMHSGVKSVDPATNTVTTDFETLQAALVNVIPAQTVGRIALSAGLANETGYCPIDAFTMKSRFDPNIYVLGDACIPGDMPKSSFAANSQAKVAAMSIRGELLGARAFPAQYFNTCWSLVETDDCIKVGGRYEATSDKIREVQGFVSQPEDTAERRRQNYQESLGWYAAITADMFG
ncbi:MAG: NAD(P)/FAD-dependent oxidoreductase [Hyphomicrobiales bacterium]|nr:NAD(P)/FAD-dependent oxidoreductase [Hyphomicrobiales bacterium]